MHHDFDWLVVGSKRQLAALRLSEKGSALAEHGIAQPADVTSRAKVSNTSR